jgi:hypothetical protein
VILNSLTYCTLATAVFWVLIPYVRGILMASIFRIEEKAEHEISRRGTVNFSDFLLGLLFDPEDGVDIIPETAGCP